MTKHHYNIHDKNKIKELNNIGKERKKSNYTQFEQCEEKNSDRKKYNIISQNTKIDRNNKSKKKKVRDADEEKIIEKLKSDIEKNF